MKVGPTREKEDRKMVGQSELMISRRSDCRLMKCTTMLHLPNVKAGIR